MYVIAECSGKGFIEKSRKFTVSGHAGNVWELDDSTHAKVWAEEQERFNEARTVDKATAQTAINEGTDSVDFDGNPITPHQL
jgi:hypothetical protein|tara:strand:- start:14 stop:259 length:246 start_codon:yes stop_codon:yes gene_type:complete